MFTRSCSLFSAIRHYRVQQQEVLIRPSTNTLRSPRLRAAHSSACSCYTIIDCKFKIKKEIQKTDKSNQMLQNLWCPANT